MITSHMIENAHKITYLMHTYPEKNLGDIIKLLAMPALDINVGIWTAQELGLIDKPDEKTSKAKVLDLPAEWDFGTTVNELMEQLVYALGKVAEQEGDFEENSIQQWLAGYAPHDVAIALRKLLEDKVLAEYEIHDYDKKTKDTSTYTFYTLYENRGKQWGSKQFKNPPIVETKKG